MTHIRRSVGSSVVLCALLLLLLLLGCFGRFCVVGVAGAWA